MKTNILIYGLTGILLSGCTCFPKAGTEKVASVSQVLDLVKDELNVYQVDNPAGALPQSKCNKDGSDISLSPKGVTVTLETVALHKSEPSAGLTDPIGVISFDPSFSGSYSQKRTQTLVIPLAINQDVAELQVKAPGEHPLAAAITEFRHELIKVNHDKFPCLGQSDKEKITLTISFDVVNSTTGGFALKLVPIKFGDKETFSNEAHQKIQLSFNLNGSLFLLPQ